MAAALECWSSRASTDEDMVEQVLMRTHDRSEGPSPETSSSCTCTSSASLPPGAGEKDPSSAVLQKKLQRLTRNVSEAIASLKNSLNLDSSRDPPSAPSKIDGGHRKLVWGGIVRSLTQLYPGSQLPEKLVSNIRKHYDSMPVSYSQAGFDVREVFVHIRLMEQCFVEERPAILIQEALSNGGGQELQHPSASASASTYKVTFASNSSVSWPALSSALDSASVCCKKLQIFERKGSALGILLVHQTRAEQETSFKPRIESILRAALSKKPKQSGMKLAFGLCGSQEESNRCKDLGEMDQDGSDQSYRNGAEYSNWKIQLTLPLPSSSFKVSVDEWQTIRSGGDEAGKWLLNSDNLEFLDQIGPYSFKGVYKGKKVSIEKLKGCDKGNSYDFELRKDLLELMTCGHRNVVQFHGVCIDEMHGLCAVTRYMEGGSVHDLMMKNKKLQMKDVMRIAVDVAEGMKFMNDHGVAYRDLNTHRILLDRHSNACLGDMGIVVACRSIGETMEYETDGYRWLAPEIIAGDPESVSETWMSNVYSFGMVVWEMVTGEAAYSAYSPVQAAVGIAACGLRPEIPKDCPQMLKSLMLKCWTNAPSKRPEFADVLSMLLRYNYNQK